MVQDRQVVVHGICRILFGQFKDCRIVFSVYTVKNCLYKETDKLSKRDCQIINDRPNQNEAKASIELCQDQTNLQGLSVLYLQESLSEGLK